MRTPGRVAALCVLLASIVLAGQAPSSDHQRAPTFRSEVTYIEVHVLVTDRGGRFVSDLRREDFVLLQDGEPQELASFTVVDLPPPLRPAPAPGLALPNTAGEVPEDGRVYALLLDAPLVFLIGGGDTREPEIIREIRQIQRVASLFLDQAFGAQDRMSVVHVQKGSRPVQDLTSSPARVQAAIDALMPPPRTPDDVPRFGPVRTIRPPGPLDGGGIPNAFRVIEEVSEQLGAINGRRKAILWIGGHAPFDDVSLFSSPRTDRRVPAGSSAAQVGSLVLQGRDAIRAAVRNNVAVYPIDHRGLTMTTGRRELLRTSGLREIAAETDGIALVNTNRFSDGFDRIVQDNSTYYLLGYYPVVAHRDGRFHTITVHVNRPGVSVRARRGFFAPEGPAPPATVVVARTPAAAAVEALGATDSREPLRVRAATWMPSPGGNGALWVVGELDARTRRERAWASGWAAEVVVLAQNGDRVFSKTVDMASTDPSFTVRNDRDAGLAPGSYTVHVQLQGANTVSLGELARIVIAAGAPALGDALLWRRGPATGPRHVPTADPRFRRNERLRLELPTSSDAPAFARLLDRTGASMQVPVQVSYRHEDDMRWVVVDVPLASLAPSDYAVEVAQGEAVRVTAFRLVS